MGLKNFVFDLQRFKDINNFDSSIVVSGTNGDDSIFNSGDFVTVKSDKGNDNVENLGEEVSIDGGADDDYIKNTEIASLSTINGGNGNDTVENYASKAKVDGGLGEDSIRNGEYDVSEIGANSTLNGGDGNDTVENYASNVTIKGGDGDDEIRSEATYENHNSNILIDGGNGDDIIIGYNSDSVTILGGAGNDNIDNNDGKSVSISGGEGDDTITNEDNENVSIDGGVGNDYIENIWGSNVSINGGDGDNTIRNDSGDNVTITGGKGNNLINMTAGGYCVGASYIYGGGNDTIENLANSYQPIVIADATWSSIRSDDDIIIKVKGQGMIRLVSCYWMMDRVNIVSSIDEIKHYNITDNAKSKKNIKGTAKHDYIFNAWITSDVTINAGAGDDVIINDGANTSINGGDGDDNIRFVGANNTIHGGNGNDIVTFWDGINNAYVYTAGNDTIEGLGESHYLVIADATWSSVRNDNDVIIKVKDKGTIRLKNYGEDKINIVSSLDSSKRYNVIISTKNNAVISGTSGNDYIVHGDNDNATINAGDGNDYIWNAWGSENVSLNGGNGDDTIENGNDFATIEGGKGNDSLLSYNRFSVINGGAGNDTIHTNSNNTISGGTGNDYIQNGGDYVIFNYVSGDGNDTIEGFNENSMLSISGGSYSTTKSGEDIIVTVGKGKITLQGAANLSYVNINDRKTYSENLLNHLSLFLEPYSDVLTYKGHRYRVYSGGNSWREAKYYCEELGGHLATITDSGEQKAIQDFLAEQGFNGSYFLGGTDEDNEGTWKWVTGEKFSYNNWNEGQPDNAGGNENYLEIRMDWDNGVWNDTSNCGGFICEWDAETPTDENTWTLNGTTAKYGTSSKTLVTVKGVKSVDGLSLNDKVVTVSNESLNNSKVTISGDGYTLALGADVTKPSTTKDWSLSKTTATYKQTTTAGYTLADNAITYTKKATTTLATVKGVTSIDGLSVSKKVVTVSAASLGTSKVTISDGYTLALGADVTKPSTKKAAWSIKNSTATYKSSYKTAGYKLASNSKSIIYSAATTVETLASIKGATSTDGLSVSGNTIKAASSSLKNKVTVSSGYAYDFAADYKSSTITGSADADTLTARGTKLSVKGGAGNDTIKILGSGTVTGGKGSDTFYFKSTGANVISDYAAEDKISIASGTASISTSGDDLILKFGKGSVTVTGGKDKAVTYFDSEGEHLYKKPSASSVKYNSDGTSATLTAKYTADEFTPSEYSQYADVLVSIDASKIDYSLKIVGNKRANKITGTSDDDIIDGGRGADVIRGGKGSDSIFGNKGNDSLYGGENSDTLWGGAGDDYLWGGDGNDIFVYSDGNDKIFDYVQGLDKIMILSGEEPKLAGTPTSDDVTFKVGSGKITVVNGAHTVIEFVDSNGTHLDTYYPEK